MCIKKRINSTTVAQAELIIFIVVRIGFSRTTKTRWKYKVGFWKGMVDLQFIVTEGGKLLRQFFVNMLDKRGKGIHNLTHELRSEVKLTPL